MGGDDEPTFGGDAPDFSQQPQFKSNNPSANTNYEGSLAYIIRKRRMRGTGRRATIFTIFCMNTAGIAQLISSNTSEGELHGKNSLDEIALDIVDDYLGNDAYEWAIHAGVYVASRKVQWVNEFPLLVQRQRPLFLLTPLGPHYFNPGLHEPLTRSQASRFFASAENEFQYYPRT